MCNAGVPYTTSSNNFSIKCVCGTQLPLLKVFSPSFKIIHVKNVLSEIVLFCVQALKGLGDTEAQGELAKKELDAGNLAKAQELYIQYMIALDELLVPPYADYYKIQQYIW